MNEDDRVRVRLCADLIMLAVAEEREACAKLAEDHAPQSPPGVLDTRVIHGRGMASTIAVAIRARGAKEGK